MSLRVLIQARMSSRRFPGKVLAPFRGRPLIDHVISGVRRALGEDVALSVLTSSEISDAPLVKYLCASGVDVFRGSLGRVVDRFREALLERPCERFMRICADSPLLNASVLRALIKIAADYDLVTTTFPRTLPRGQNAELLKTSTFLDLPVESLMAEELEHITLVYYRNPNSYRIFNLTSGDPSLAQCNLSVDSIEDLVRLEQLSRVEVSRLSSREYHLC
jgi:spore coat polysaccharide biosynthesis protein SpsF